MNNMKNTIFIIACIISLLTVVGCNSPYKDVGYGVSIRIDNNAIPTVSDLKLITDYLSETVHEEVTKKGKDSWGVESYKIMLNEKKFEGIEHKYIMFVVEYNQSVQVVDDKKLLKNIEVRIGNSWDGRKPVMKNEIDSIVNKITDKLGKRFGKSNITVTSRFETPM